MKYKCICCGSSEIKNKIIAYKRENIKSISAEYCLCANCNSFYLYSLTDTNESADYDERYDIVYKKLLKKLRNKIYRKLACFFLGVLSGLAHIALPKNIKKNQLLLDVGCGIGLNTKLLIRKGLKIIGIDSSIKAIEYANEISDGEKYINTKFEEFNHHEKFDYIRADNVIEHNLHPMFFLEKALELLKFGGKLIIFTPNAQSASIKLLGGKSVSFWANEHRVIFSEKGLSNLCSKAGFQEVKIKKNTPAWWLSYNILLLLGISGNISADSFLLKILSFLLLPIAFLLNFINMNEEIIIIATK